MKFLFIKLLILVSFNSLGDIYYENINGYEDKDCPSWNSERFDNIKQWKTFGVRGSTQFGFDYEIPIKRQGVTLVWCAVVPHRGIKNKYCKKIKNDLFTDTPFQKFKHAPSDGDHNFATKEEQYNYYLKIAREAIKREKFDRPNEGLVLEILSRYYLQDYTGMFPKSDYTVGGGVAYKRSSTTNTVGELDILVWDKKTCDVVMVGESKAAANHVMKKRLLKAKNQLKRFRLFLQENK